jgi:hypothetical protein
MLLSFYLLLGQDAAVAKTMKTFAIYTGRTRAPLRTVVCGILVQIAASPRFASKEPLLETHVR